MDDVVSQGENQAVNTQTAPIADERVFKQTEVNDLVGRARREGAEAAERRLNQQQQNQGRQAETPTQGMSHQSNGLDETAYRKMAADEAQRLVDNIRADAQTKAETDAAQRIVQNFWNKISTGKEKYQDFDKVTGDIEYARFPNTVQLLADYVDNSADVLYELGKDRFKMAQLEQLSQISPKDAIIQAKRLADSIKENNQAAQAKTPNQPLNQMRPSNAGTDSGVLTVSDYRKLHQERTRNGYK